MSVPEEEGERRGKECPRPDAAFVSIPRKRKERKKRGDVRAILGDLQKKKRKHLSSGPSLPEEKKGRNGLVLS